MQIKYLIIFSLNIVFSVCLIELYKKLVNKFKILFDVPNMRSSHSRAIPRGGGIAIVISFVCILPMLNIINNPSIIGYLCGGAIIALVGFLDDILGLKSIMKILGMVLASICPIIFGNYLHYLDIIHSEPVLIILSIIWIYGMINAFNFMDGIDGLIPGVSAVFSMFIFGYGIISGNAFAIIIALITASSCISFMLFNYNPASIFLGDIGSMFLGYNFALLSIMVVNQSGNKIPIYMFIMLFSLIIYDAMVTFIKRGIQGKNVLSAHREHLYQRLIIIGYSQRKISILFYSLSIIFGIGSLLYFKAQQYEKLMIIIFIIAALFSFSVLVQKLERAK